MSSEGEICRLCLKTMAETEKLFFIDEELKQDFFNITQMVLNEIDGASKSICEVCLRSVQYANALKNQLIENQKKFSQALAINEIFVSSIKTEDELVGQEVESNEPENFFLDELLPIAENIPDQLTEEQKKKQKKRVACCICNNTFADSYKLKRHILRLHTQERKEEDGKESVEHICSECGKVFMSLNALKSHSIYHRNPSHVCEYCSKVFFELPSLRHHINSNHLNVKAYKCNYCDNEYFKQHHLNRHILRAHKNQRFYCTSCGKSFARKEKCRHHLKIAHNISPEDLDSSIKEVRDDEKIEIEGDVLQDAMNEEEEEA